MSGLINYGRSCTPGDQPKFPPLRPDHQVTGLLDSLPVPILIRDPNGALLHANPACREALGADAVWGQEALAGWGIGAATGEMVHREWTWTNGGGDRTLLVRAFQARFPVWGDAEVALLEDITGLKQTEVELARERDFVRIVFDTADALIMVLDLEGRIQRWNQACQRVTGYHEAEVRGLAGGRRLPSRATGSSAHRWRWW